MKEVINIQEGEVAAFKENNIPKEKWESSLLSRRVFIFVYESFH
jgi:hypothetical protein